MTESILHRLPTYERRLRNGLTVLVREDHSAPVVAIVTYVKAGYFDEAEEVSGISHVLEHMYFKGTPSRGVGEIAQATKQAGGYLNAGTIYDHTSYYTVLPSSSLAEGLDIQSDALLNSSIDAGELERELRVIVQEAKRKLDNPHAVAQETLFATMFDAHRMRRWRIGTEPVLSGFTRDDVAGFYRAHYTAPNTILVIAGDVDAERTFEMVEQRYGHMDATVAPHDRGPVEPPLHGPRYVEMEGDISQVHVEWGWRAPDALHADAPALDVLATALGSGRASRLYRHVRDAGLAASVSAFNYTPGDIGIFGIGAEVQPAELPAAMRRMGDTLRDVFDNGFTVSETARARNIIEARTLRRLETAEGQANVLAEWQALGDWKSASHYLDEVMSVTPDRMQECARRYLAPELLTALVYQPRGSQSFAADAVAFQQQVFGGDYVALSRVPDVNVQRGADPEIATPAVYASSITPDRVEDGVRFYTVAGGHAHVVIKPRDTTPLVSMSLYCRGGSLAERPGLYGITGLMSRTSVKGTRTRMGVQLAEETEALGGSISAGAGADTLDWSLSIPSRHLAAGVDLLLDAALEPVFAVADAERERKLALADIEQARDDMSQYPMRLALSAAFDGHSYGVGLPELEASLRGLDVSALPAWHRDRVLHGSPHVFITGDVPDPDVAAAIIGARLAAHVGAPLPLDARAAVWPDNIEARVEGRDKAQTAIALAFPGPPRSHADVHALQLLSSAIAGLGGRLFEELRSRRSLAYSVSASPLPRWLGGAFVAFIGTAPEREEEAHTELLRELHRTTEELLSAEEMERARRYLLGSWQIRQQTNGRQLADLAAAVLLGEGLEELRAWESRVRAVTLEDMRDAAARWIRPDRVATGIVRGAPALVGSAPAAR